MISYCNWMLVITHPNTKAQSDPEIQLMVFGFVYLTVCHQGTFVSHHSLSYWPICCLCRGRCHQKQPSIVVMVLICVAGRAKTPKSLNSYPSSTPCVFISASCDFLVVLVWWRLCDQCAISRCNWSCILEHYGRSIFSYSCYLQFLLEF